MAAIYSGIHLKLKSPQTPWEDKVKLARFAWISSQCLLPNKEQVLLDWCTHALTGWYNQKVEFSQNVLDSLWCYLDDLLHSRKLHTPLKQGKTTSLRLNMAQLLLDRLQECSRAATGPPASVSTLLSVCQGVLSSPALSSVFTTKYDLMVDLLTKLCSFACRELQQPVLTESCQPMTECLQTQPDDDLDTSQTDLITESPSDHPQSDKSASNSKDKHILANLFEVLLQVLSCYLSVQRQQANPNRVFTLVTNQLIQPLVLLRHLLTSGEHTPSHSHLRLHQQLCRDIRVKIESIIQLALFPSEHLTSYKEELLPPKEDSGKRGPGGAKGPLKPVSSILCKLSAQGYCEPSLHYSVKSNTLSLLFKFFLESYGKGSRENEEEQRMLCFYFLTRLILALDVGLDERSLSPAKADQLASVYEESLLDSPRSPESWSLALLAVESLLSQALSADIYNVAADRIRHKEVQLNFYRELGQIFFNQAQPSIPAWYRCLKALLSLNHLILEPDLDQLLSSAWVNADCMEARVQRARQVMLCSLLQTYTKLRQLPRLFSELLSVICQPALDDLRPPLLSKGISTSFRICLLDTPASQGLEICSLVLESIRKNILPDLVKEDSESEKMEIDGGDNEVKEHQERSCASLKLFSLSQLLHTVLFSLKTLDNASPLPLVRQSQGLMEEMQRVVKDLMQLFSAEKMALKTNLSSIQRTQGKGKKNLDHKESQKASDFETRKMWEEKTQEAALLLKYTWVEVDTLFHIHCSKYISFDSAQTAAGSENKDRSVLMCIEGLLSCEVEDSVISVSCSPMSRLLLKLLTLQQMKKALLDTPSVAEESIAAVLNKAALFILSKEELEVSVDGEQVWDGHIDNVNDSSYLVAHWYLVTSNLPLLAPHLNREDVGYVANVLVESLLSRHSDRGKDGCLTVPLLSSHLLQSAILPELPSLFSATVCFLTQRIFSVLVAAHAPNVCPTLLAFQEALKGQGQGQPLTTQVKKETMVEDISTSSKTGEVYVLLTDTQTKELLNLLQILINLNPDGMSSEDLSTIFLLLLFMLSSTSCHTDQMTADPPASSHDVVFLKKLLRILTCLLEGKNFQGVLKLIHGSTLLQAVVSSILWHSHSGRFCSASNSEWLDLIKAVQAFIGSLVQLIIVRNSSVRLNLEQFASYLTSKEVASRPVVAASATSVADDDPGASVQSIPLLLASLTAFSQTMTSHLGRSKPMDQTLTQLLARTTASLGPAVESILKLQIVGQPASQAFVVEVVTVMLNCELSALSAEEENKQNGTQLTLGCITLYRGFCQQIHKEISSAPRPMDFLVASLHFLAAFYQALQQMGQLRDEEQKEGKTEGNELDELYIQTLQNVHRLLTAPWLSATDLCELEPPVQKLLHHLVEKSTTGQFNLLLLMIREGLDTGKLRAGNYKEVLSAVIIIKLLSSCQLPEPCSKALWLIAPQVISALVFLVRSSSHDISLTLPFTIPAVMSMTSLLRQGEGFFTNPHHVILILGALQSVPLDHLTPVVYHSAFLAIHEALFAIIQCHPQVMLNAAPPFLNVFHRLVASIMHEGRQRGDSDTGPDSEVYLQCSRLIERMYSHIAAVAESFTTLSAFMVAEYVTELQKVTLRPDIKLHLTEGIYRILDLCMEQDIKFLTAGLQMGVREVFNELYGSYTHYHKAQRQGEDKYTV